MSNVSFAWSGAAYPKWFILSLINWRAETNRSAEVIDQFFIFAVCQQPIHCIVHPLLQCSRFIVVRCTKYEILTSSMASIMIHSKSFENKIFYCSDSDFQLINFTQHHPNFNLFGMLPQKSSFCFHVHNKYIPEKSSHLYLLYRRTVCPCWWQVKKHW